MTEKTKQEFTNTFDIEDSELQETLEDFYEEEKKQEKSIWNISTITGFVMLFIVVGVLGQSIAGSLFGLEPAFQLTGLMNIMPVIGGILVLAAGFGFLTGDRKKEKKSKLKSGFANDFNYSSTSKPVSPYSSKDKLDDFLNIDESDRKTSKTRGKYSFRDRELEAYALSQKKKLFRSRTDKKILGVCGGLAKYFGVSSTMVRIIFVLAFLLGYGSFLIVYIVLGIIMPKEPFDLAERYNFKSD